MTKPDDTQPPPGPNIIDQIAKHHTEIESLVKVAALAWKNVTQPDRTHEWHLSVLLISSLLFIVSLSAALAAIGRFGSEAAFVLGTALGVLAALLKDFLLPVGD